jgi:hypothetical protein
MPIFHFEVRTPTHVIVTEGVELTNHTAARVEAARRIGVLLNEHAGQLWVDQEWQMDITDADGLILYIIQVSTSNTAATQGAA